MKENFIYHPVIITDLRLHSAKKRIDDFWCRSTSR